MDELCPELDDGIAVRISSGKNSSAYAISSLENHDSQARSCQHCGCGKSSHPRASNDYVRVKVHNFAPNKGWVQAWMTFLDIRVEVEIALQVTIQVNEIQVAELRSDRQFCYDGTRFFMLGPRGGSNMFSSLFQCQDCGGFNGYRSRPRNFTEKYILPMLLLRPVRCGDCFRRSLQTLFVQVRERQESRKEHRAAA